MNYDMIDLFRKGNNISDDVTAVLDFWTASQKEAVSQYILWGDCYGDKKKRFPNEQYIHTSVIDGSPEGLKEGDKVTTRNSTYILGRKGPEISIKPKVTGIKEYNIGGISL